MHEKVLKAVKAVLSASITGGVIKAFKLDDLVADSIHLEIWPYKR